MVWPFKKDKDGRKTRRRRFQSLSQNKLGSRRRKEEEVEIPLSSPEEVEQVSENLEDLEELKEEELEKIEDLEELEEVEELEELEEIEEDFALKEKEEFPGLDKLKKGEEDLEDLDEDLDDEDLDDVDELSLEEEEEEEEEEIIPSGKRIGTMRIQQKPTSSPVPMKVLAGEGGGKKLTEEQKKLARILLACGGVTQEEVERELDAAGKKDSVLGKGLMSMGFVSEEKLYPLLLAKYRTPKLNIQNTKVPSATLRLLSARDAHRLRVIPIEPIGKILCVALDDLKEEKIVELRKLTGMKIIPLLCSKEGMDFALQRFYPHVEEEKEEEVVPQVTTGEQKVIQAIPISTNDVQGAIPLRGGRYCNVAAHWMHIHWKGLPVVPEEAKL